MFSDESVDYCRNFRDSLCLEMKFVFMQNCNCSKPT